MALRLVGAAASSCRIKLGFLGAVSNHQIHLLFPPQLSRQFRRPPEICFPHIFLPPPGLCLGSAVNKLGILGPPTENTTIHSNLKDPEVVEPALFAVKIYNMLKKADLQFVRVVKATSGFASGIIYNITLEAINCDVKKTYKTRVWLNAERGCILELLKFELDLSNRSNKQAVDKKVGAEKKGGGGETKEVSQILNKLVGCFGSKKNALDAKEIFDVVSKIPDLSESEVYKACSWLVENEMHFRMLKLFADDKKKGYLLSAMPRD